MLIFLFRVLLGKKIERLGYVLAHRIFFPLFRLVDRARRAYLKQFGSLQATLLEGAAHYSTFMFVVGIFIVILIGTETRAFSTNDHLSGKYNLFSVYVGPGEEDLEIVEEGLDQGFYVPNSENAQVGVAVPAGLPGAEAEEGIPMDMIDYEYDGVISRSFMPGIVPTGSRDSIIEYTIQSGDNLGGIAARFSISLQTLIWENNLTARSVLQIGQKLRILPVTGVSHKIQKGDTIARLAKTYNAKSEDITEFNKIDDAHLAVGSIIVVPGGRKITTGALPSSRLAAPGVARGRYIGGTPPPSLRNVGQGMSWPTTVRYITQYFRLRHPGIDIAAPIGTPIYTSDDGVVTASGWNRGGYGYMILVDHGNGIVTRYAHNSRLFVNVGERIFKGQTIALMGSTGRSTGSHLHFEVIVGGVRVNPFLYVR